MNLLSLPINAAASSATRYIISQHAGLPKNQALVFNGVDMAVSGLVSYLFATFKTAPNVDDDLFKLFASRVISLISTIIITNQTMGEIDLGIAFALNAVAGTVGLIALVIQWTYGKEAPLIMT